MVIKQFVKLYWATQISFSTKWVLNSYQESIKQKQLLDLDYYFNLGVTINFPDGSEYLDQTVLKTFLQEGMVSENGDVLWNEEQIRSKISEICSRHLSGNNNLLFKTTLKTSMIIPASMPWATDVVGTINEVKEALHEKRGIVTASIVKADTSESLYYLPSLYAEVSIQSQHMWLYKDGVLILDSPVTTGKFGSETNIGVHKIELMQTNRILRGPDYALPVNYWIRFNSDAEGFHDATWRNEFGTTDFQQNGSHGCVNMPVDKIAQLYHIVTVGVPVIIY